uniref:Uncharacterized protein n=1 Tax=Moniliophthora roreri TaxID=221103 RepID=A0A0W0FVA9_MONRR
MANDFSFESIYSIQGVLLAPFVSVGVSLLHCGHIDRHSFKEQIADVVSTRFLHFTLRDGGLLSVHAAKYGEQETPSWLGDRAIYAISFIFSPFVRLQRRTPSHWRIGSPHLKLPNPDIFSGMFYVFANCIADGILLYRCFAVWESAKGVIIVLLLVLLATNAMGLIGHIVIYVALGIDQDELYSGINDALTGYNVANAVNTLILTLIIAGRIWWMTRDARKFLGQEIGRTYRRIIIILIESGFIYSASLIVTEALIQSGSNLGFGLSLNPVIHVMVGIAPTLIILHTSLGLTESAIPDSRMISTLRFGDSPAAATTNSGQNSAVHGVDLEQGTTSTSDDQEAPKIERSDTSTSSA